MNDRFVTGGILVCALCLGLGCRTTSVPSGPNAYNDYDVGMRHWDGYQMAYEWQQTDSDSVDAVTRPEILAAFVVSDAAADELLGRIGKAYDGDPAVLTQIAAVTQFVMNPKVEGAPLYRRRWSAALERVRAKTDDGYVRTFCEQQLRICR